MPSIILGMVVFVFLPNSIETAYFLTPEEREVLAAEVSLDHVPGPLAADLRGSFGLLKDALKNGYIMLASFCGMLTSVASHT